MAGPRKERAYEKYAWVILLAIQIVEIGFRSRTSQGFELLDYSLVGLSIVGIVITLRPYRAGRKWAWYFLWYIPAAFIGEAAYVTVILQLGLFGKVFLGQPAGAASITFFYEFIAFFTILALLGLFLPYRKFFPKKQLVSP